MKKLLSVILLIVAILTITVFAEEVKPVTVTLNGNVVDCASYGQEATIVEGRTLVPLRAIFEALGASVEWDSTTKTVTSTLGGTTVKLTIGEKTLYKNESALELDVPAMIMNDRTLVPVRAVSEAFGVDVSWDSNTRTVILFDGSFAYNAYLENTLEQLIPKTELDEEVLATAGGIPVSAAHVRSAVLMACSNNQNLEDENTIKGMEDFYKQNAALVRFAYNEGIILDETDVTMIKSNIVGLQIQLGDNYERAFAESPYTKFFYHLNTSLYSVLFTKLSDVYTGSDNQEMRQRALSYLEENEYVRAKHILIQFPEVGYGEKVSAEQRKETLEKTLKVLSEVNSMTDISEFDALIEKYNEDPGMNTYTDGYYFTRGEMVEPFEQATYALEEGKTSAIVETDYGFHIILRLPLDDDKLVNSDAYAQAVSYCLSDLLMGIADSYEIEYYGTYDARVQDFAKEYEIMFPADEE